MKRMQRCAPQYLRRQAEYQKRLAQCSGEMTARVTCVAHYVFFYYHGVHAMHWSSWLQAAFAIHCKANGWHAASRQACFVASGLSMVSMALYVTMLCALSGYGVLLIGSMDGKRWQSCMLSAGMEYRHLADIFANYCQNAIGSMDGHAHPFGHWQYFFRRHWLKHFDIWTLAQAFGHWH